MLDTAAGPEGGPLLSLPNPFARTPMLVVVWSWTALALISTSATFVALRTAGPPTPTWVAIASSVLLATVPWVFFTPVIVVCLRSWPLNRARRWQSLPKHLAVATAWTVAYTLLIVPLRPMPAGVEGGRATLEFLFVGSFPERAADWGLYWVVLALAAAWDLRTRLAHETAAAQELAARNARLRERLANLNTRLLRHRLEPHFVQNALNAIQGLVRSGRSEQAAEMIAGVGRLLRHAMAEDRPLKVALREEIDVALAYLDVQRTRYGERLRLDLDIDPGALDTPVPSLMLQPLVENAVEHGADADGCARLRLEVTCAEGRATVTIVNGGVPGGAAPSPGGGLALTRSRLEDAYGDRASFDFTTLPTGGARATLRLPMGEGPD